MQYRTHLAFGAMFALLAKGIVDVNSYLFVALAMFAALLPDLDHPESYISRKLIVFKPVSVFLRHRGIVHSVFTALLLSIIIWLAISPGYSLAIFIGFISHLFADGLNVSGLRPFYPISSWRMRGPIRTGGIIDKIVFIAVLILIAILLLS